MTTHAATIAARNPFSSKFVKPGAIPYLFQPGQDLQSLITRLEQQNWWGQIIGPHGTGKSTLIAELQGAMQAAGREPQHYRLRDQVNTLPGWSAKALRLNGNSVLVIDGFEQVAPWARWFVRRTCRLANCGLIVTAHAPIGLPDLYSTKITTDLANRVLNHLQRESAAPFASEVLTERLQVRQGNLREALFDLYDLHERTRSKASRGV